MITYNTRLLAESQADIDSLVTLLQWHRLAFNNASKIQFNEKQKSIVILHSKFYYGLRRTQPQIPSQVLIRGEQECLSAYKSIKSNKHKISCPIEKKRLSMRLDKRLYSHDKNDKLAIKITTANKRKKFKFVLYPKLIDLLNKYQYRDPLIYINEKNEVCISFSFDTKKQKLKQKLAVGVDLGIRVSAATSEGMVIIDKKFNAEKRRLRFNRRKLQSKGTKSARRHLKKLRHKERNKNKNQTHLIANAILKTNADTIVLENLKSIKVKKNKYQNKNSISQVPLYELRRIITYKAENQGKTVLLVCPAWTSQTDCLTGKIEGKRAGRRFYAKNRMIYDSDINAAINIAKLSKLPVSQTTNLTYGQAVVNRLNVCKSRAQANVLQAAISLG